MNTVLALALTIAIGGPPAPRVVKGLYRLPAKGFSVKIPDRATGLLEGDAVVERGIRILLASGSSVFVFGEPNSLEWPSPADGIRWIVAEHRECSAGEVSSTRVGKLPASGARLSCGEKVAWFRLLFRPGGGPVYWLRLETTVATEAADTAALEKVAASFRLIRWE